MSTSTSPQDAISEHHAKEKEILTAYFEKKYPECDKIELTDFSGPKSGMSNETRFFTLHKTKGNETSSQGLGVRWAPLGDDRQFDEYDIGFQYHAMKALASAGITVPEMLFLEEDTSIIGGPFYVMEKVEGHIISDYPPGAHGAGYLHEATPAMRKQIWWRSLEVMAQVNHIDWNQPEFAYLDKPASGQEALRGRLAMMRNQLQYASDTPIEIIETAMTWLEQNMPENPRLALCWSDGRPGNIIWQNYEPVAACDWETMYIGPPENDMAWFILVDEVAEKSHGQTRLEGIPSTSESIAYYEELLGYKFESVNYYFVMQAALLAILMALSAKKVLTSGMAGFPEDYATNNVATAILARELANAGG